MSTEIQLIEGKPPKDKKGNYLVKYLNTGEKLSLYVVEGNSWDGVGNGYEFITHYAPITVKEPELESAEGLPWSADMGPYSAIVRDNMKCQLILLSYKTYGKSNALKIRDYIIALSKGNDRTAINKELLEGAESMAKIIDNFPLLSNETSKAHRNLKAAISAAKGEKV